MLKISLSDLWTTSTRSIFKNKGRTLLTSLGIIIGVSSVILLKSIGVGLENYVTNQFESLGSNLVFVMPGKVFNDQGGFNNGGQASFLSRSFTYRDLQFLRRGLTNVETVVPIVQLSSKAKFRDKQMDITLEASTHEYGQIRNTIPSSGNGAWFTKEDEGKSSPVIVIGSQIATDLFGSQSPLDKKLTVNGKSLKVIGIVDKKGGGGFGGPNFDKTAYIPITTGFSLAGNENIMEFVLQADSNDSVATVKRQADRLLLQKYEKDTFSVIDQTQILTSINSIIGTLTVALSGIAAISLVVGGIGIMNIMLVTVSERTKEIGLRKAVGGTPIVILLQFLTEAIILSCIGGLFGVILGSLATFAVSNFFPAQVTWDSIIMAFGVSTAVGIVFGVAPARKAALLSPIEALRYE